MNTTTILLALLGVTLAYFLIPRKKRLTSYRILHSFLYDIYAKREKYFATDDQTLMEHKMSELNNYTAKLRMYLHELLRLDNYNAHPILKNDPNFIKYFGPNEDTKIYSEDALKDIYDELKHEQEIIFFKKLLSLIKADAKNRIFYKKISLLASSGVLVLYSARTFDVISRFHYDLLNTLITEIAPNSHYKKSLSDITKKFHLKTSYAS